MLRVANETAAQLPHGWRDLSFYYPNHPTLQPNCNLLHRDGALLRALYQVFLQALNAEITHSFAFRF